TTAYNTMLVACFGRSDNQVMSPPSGMSERFHVESASSGGTSTDAGSESADVLQATVGTTGAKTATVHTAQVSQLIALAPPGSGCAADTVRTAGTSCTDDGNVCT